MPRIYLLCTVTFCAWAGSLAAAKAVTDGEAAERLETWQKTFDADILPILQQRCLDCHSGEQADGEFDLSPFTSGAAAAEKLELWSEVGKRVRLREMPPEGSPQLNDAQKSVFHRWLDSQPQSDLCSELATDETQAWYRGVVMSRRLTRTEYRNAMRDIVGVAVDPRFELPSDGAGGEGFDTNGDSLFTSPIHIEQYLAIASEIVERVLGSTAESPPELAAAKQALLAGSAELLAKDPSAEQQAAQHVVQRFARLAWRRPVDQEELERLLALFSSARASRPDFASAVAEPLKAVLISPHFLFVVESESPAGGVQQLTPHQLATRLALFLWSSAPDEQLLHAADTQQLATPPQVIAQARRMLRDPKARALGENFGLQWLGLTNFLTSVQPDGEVYPEFDPQLANDMLEEATLTVAELFREDRPLPTLLDADFVYANGNLAQHYGLDVPAGAEWQLVSLSSEPGASGRGGAGRGGVITLGATLASTSYPRRTSPVLRGRWLLEEVLGSSVPPPPENVPALEETVADQAASLRERLELHRQNAECAACHNRMDPLGFGLENFDGLGRWREKEQGIAIDASGTLPSGESFVGPAELKTLLLARSREFETHFIRKLLGFALGRGLNKFDQCVIDDCFTALEQRERRASAVIETIVTSYPFQHRYFKSE